MKKLFFIWIILALTACEELRYDDYIQDFDYTSVYFPFQDLERSFVYGEFNNIQVAVQMGGRRENKANEWVEYVIDDEIPVDENLTFLSSEYYTLSDENQFPILPGDLGGELTLTVTEEFFNMADTTAFYIPFRLTDTSVDTILENKTTMILTLNVETAKFGHYYHNGVTEIDSVNGNTSTIVYHQEEPVTNAINNWELISYSHDTLVTDGISDKKAGPLNYSFRMVIDDNNNVTISPNIASVWQVTPDGESTYNPDKREFYINYKYQDADGNNYTAKDTLIFRNRILDGVNQWQ